MRVTDSAAYRTFLANMETLNEQLDRVNQQISTGKKLIHLRDAPSSAAESVLLSSEAAELDQYKTNLDSCSFYLQVADSALNSVQNLIASIQSKGIQAASGTVDAATRATIAMDIRSLRDQMLSLANSEVRGRYIFAGSKVTAAPFAISGDAVSYEGDTLEMSVDVGDGLKVQQNVAGSSVFSPIFDAIQSLLSEIDSGDQAGIQQSLTQLSSSLSGFNLARGMIGTELSKAQTQSSENGTESANLRAQQSRTEDVNTAEAATQLSQLQTAMQASLSAGQSILQKRNLFDFLG